MSVYVELMKQDDSHQNCPKNELPLSLNDFMLSAPGFVFNKPEWTRNGPKLKANISFFFSPWSGPDELNFISLSNTGPKKAGHINIEL